MEPSDADRLNARIDMLQILLMVSIAGSSATQRDLLLAGFDKAMTDWREMLIMSKATDRYLAALDAEHQHWVARFADIARDAPSQQKGSPG